MRIRLTQPIMLGSLPEGMKRREFLAGEIDHFPEEIAEVLLQSGQAEEEIEDGAEHPRKRVRK